MREPWEVFTVYALHGNDGRIRYVGQTNDSERRYREHMRNLDWRRWFGGEIPRLTSLAWCRSRTAALLAEARWIHWAGRTGHPLLNVAFQVPDGYLLADVAGWEPKRVPPLSLAEIKADRERVEANYQELVGERGFVGSLVALLEATTGVRY